MTFRDLQIGDKFKFLETYPDLVAIKKSETTYRSVFTHHIEDKGVKVKKILIDRKKVKA